MHPRETVAAALALAASGEPPTTISVRLGVPRRTVADWIHGSTPRHTSRTGVLESCACCRAEHDLDALSDTYVYLLGLYLGDGCLSRQARDVFKLRIFLDAQYPEIIEQARRAVRSVADRQPGVLTRNATWVEVYSAWRAWPCLFPQHGPGKKHERVIALTSWQQQLVERWPRDLLRGLIQSDGCRFMNRGRAGWSAPRYAFKNRSADLHRIFRAAAEQIGIHWTAAGVDTTYVSRQADVAKLDEFIGPKR